MNRGDLYEAFHTELINRYWSLYPGRRKRKAPRWNWLDFGSGKTGIRFGWSFHTHQRFSSEIYIDVGDKGKNLDNLGELRLQVGDLPPDLEKLSWEQLPKRRACRIALYTQGEIESVMVDPEVKEELILWAIDKMTLLETTFRETISLLRP